MAGSIPLYMPIRFVTFSKLEKNATAALAAIKPPTMNAPAKAIFSMEDSDPKKASPVA